MIMFNVQCNIVLKTEAFALGGTYPSHVNKDKKFFPYEDESDHWQRFLHQ